MLRGERAGEIFADEIQTRRAPADPRGPNNVTNRPTCSHLGRKLGLRPSIWPNSGRRASIVTLFGGAAVCGEFVCEASATGVCVRMVEGVERIGAVRVQYERLAETLVLNADGDLVRGRFHSSRTSIPSL